VIRSPNLFFHDVMWYSCRMQNLRFLLSTAVVAASITAVLLALSPEAHANGCPLRFSQGTAGTTADPIRIDSVADLTVLQLNSTCYRSAYAFRQTTDLALTGVWTPIGPAGAGFNGTYDGDGHTLTGLFVDQTAVGAYKGLFGLLDGATVRNLTISGGTIIGISSNYGVLAGSAFGGTLIVGVQIVNSSVSTTGGGNEYLGGVVGVIDGATIRDTHVSGLSIAIAGSSDHIGGIVGAMYRSAVIERSSADVSITGSGEDVGGIAGFAYNGGLITDSYARGSVIGSTSVGGLLGRFYGCGTCGPLTRTYATTRVTATSVGGGLVARDSPTPAAGAVASYWDTLTSDQSTSANAAVGKTTTQLTTLSTFASAGWSIGSGWAVSTTWGICARANNGYPFLTNTYTAATEPCTDSTPAEASTEPAAGTAAGTAASTVTTLRTRNARVRGTVILTQVTLPSAGTVVQTGGVQIARLGYPAGEYEGLERRLRATLMRTCSTKLSVRAARVITLRCAVNARTRTLAEKRGLVIRLVTTFTPTVGTRLSSSTVVAFPKRPARPSGSGVRENVVG
jgi:hypothetical protein